ncbi:hypothetical protein GF324_09045, partial [bacterium]|nr:hypothetical protein [bacterium]
MNENALLLLGAILVLGIVAQWVAWRLHLPSILLLLLTGFLIGPVTGFIRPDELLGQTLFPLVSISVAVILYEGGLSLKFSEFRQVGAVVRNMISIGILITWGLATASAYYLLNFDLQLSLLLGAILTVTGPTVIIPLLRYVRPKARVSSIIKWEGILNDPIGAVLAVLMFETILSGSIAGGIGDVALGIVKTLLAGGLLGYAGAWVLAELLRRNWVPDFLQNPISLAIVATVFVASNYVQHESGLLTVTVMGVVLANQTRAQVKHIIEFKENLRVLLIATLFILLSARLELESLTGLGLNDFLFVAALILVIRPLSALVSSIGTNTSWRESLFIGWMAPRGIVAAAVTSVFAFELKRIGIPGAERLVPIIFLVIISTVTVYGLTALPLAHLLKLRLGKPQGVLIVGAHAWARALALKL